MKGVYLATDNIIRFLPRLSLICIYITEINCEINPYNSFLNRSHRYNKKALEFRF